MRHVFGFTRDECVNFTREGQPVLYIFQLHVASGRCRVMTLKYAQTRIVNNGDTLPMISQRRWVMV